MDPARRMEQLMVEWQAAGTLSGRRADYAHAVVEKWRQALYALNRITELNTTNPADSSVTSTAGVSGGHLDPDAEIRFYCDSFWTCLHSTLDVLAQLVNVVTASGLDEEDVDFASVVNHFNQSARGTLQERLDTLKRSRSYKILRDFRRCAFHRRAVYIETQVLEVSGTPGYNIGSTVVRRLVCDDPMALTPKVSKQRELNQFCERVVNQVADRLDRVILAM